MLRRSWPLPLVVLRWVDLPDSLIAYVPSMPDQPTRFYPCFISYS